MSTESGWNAFARAQAAERWRRQSAAMGRAATETIVAETRVEPGQQVLDVACGTGEPAISLAALLHNSGRVVAIDLSPQPLKIAEERARQRHLTNMEFRQGDVHQLPFPDATFDRVTSRLGVMFFKNPERAFAEMHRVLKPGGRIALLAWGPIEQPYFQSTIGTILRLVPGASLPSSATAMFKFGAPGALAGALERAGFRSIEERLQTVEWSWPGTPAEVWEYFQEVTIPFRPLLQAVPPACKAEVDAAVLAAIASHYDGAQVNFTATVALGSATA